MSINTLEILEYRIRKERKRLDAVLRELKEIREQLNRFESKFDKFDDKVGKSFLTLAYPLENQCGDPGAKASNELKEIWKDNKE